VTAVWIKAIRWCQEVFSRLTAVCCMLLTHNPCTLPQHYKRNVCGPFCSCKHRYLWVSPTFEQYFCLNYICTIRHWQPVWSRNIFCFKASGWYFNPQWNPEQAIIVASSVRSLLVSWRKCAVTKCLDLVWNLMAHGDARDGEVKGKQANGVGSQYSSTLPRNVVYPALLPTIKICDKLPSRW